MKIICENVEVSKAPGKKDYYGKYIEVTISEYQLAETLDEIITDFGIDKVRDYLAEHP